MLQMPVVTLNTVACGLLVLLLSGCASFTSDGGLDAVSNMTQQRTGQALRLSKTPSSDREAAQLRSLLTTPLTVDTAIQIALANNEGLQVSLGELGLSEADLVQAGRLRNPGISFGRISGGGNNEIDRSVMFDLVGLLTLPTRRGIEQRRFDQAKIQAALQATRLAADTRRAYFNAVAAQQTAQFMAQVSGVAQASADLAARMAKIGNWSKLDQQREQVFYIEAISELARARHHVVVTREQLTTLLSLWGDQTSFTLPDLLPPLPKAAQALPNAESEAMSQRLDIQIARLDNEATARSLNLSQATGFINVLDVGYVSKSQTGLPLESGYQVSLELPIFDWGTARTAKAQALYMQSVHRTADIAIRARSEVRVAYSDYRTSYDLARHYRDDLIPLRKKISDEMMLRYNGMLVSVFELLADSRQQINSVNASIDAQRDFWIAETNLQSAINGGGNTNEMRVMP